MDEQTLSEAKKTDKQATPINQIMVLKATSNMAYYSSAQVGINTQGGYRSSQGLFPHPDQVEPSGVDPLLIQIIT